MLDMTFEITALSPVQAKAMPRFGLVAGCPVLTLSGVRPVETIQPGDRVITRNGTRSVLAVDTVVLSMGRVVRISEGVLGKDRPEADVCVTPDQPILIRDWRAKALVGTAQAVVAAKDLCDGDYIRAEDQAELRIVSLRFAGPEVIYAAGLELGCEAALTEA